MPRQALEMSRTHTVVHVPRADALDMDLTMFRTFAWKGKDFPWILCIPLRCGGRIRDAREDDRRRTHTNTNWKKGPSRIRMICLRHAWGSWNRNQLHRQRAMGFSSALTRYLPAKQKSTELWFQTKNGITYSHIWTVALPTRTLSCKLLDVSYVSCYFRLHPPQVIALHGVGTSGKDLAIRGSRVANDPPISWEVKTLSKTCMIVIC